MGLRLDVAVELAEEHIVRAGLADLKRLMAVDAPPAPTISLGVNFSTASAIVLGPLRDCRPSAFTRPATRLSPAMIAAAPACCTIGTKRSACF